MYTVKKTSVGLVVRKKKLSISDQWLTKYAICWNFLKMARFVQFMQGHQNYEMSVWWLELNLTL